jgi:hypothetical protein
MQPDFIEVYPDILNAATCRWIMDQYESSGQAVRGHTGTGVDTKLKDSYDITISGKPDWQQVEAIIGQAAFVGLMQYVRKYPYLMVGPLALRIPNPQSGAIELVTPETIATLDEEPYLELLVKVFRSGTVNLQKYLAGQGGYPHWHSEIYPRDPHAETLHRVLLYTIYLNDVSEAGETEFFYQKRTIQPRMGSLLIAPAGFTHTHRGNTPIGGDKYIATSWVMFQRAETLY